MSDTRFASIRTDPRFRRPKKYNSKVTLDDRFKHLIGYDSDNGDGDKDKRRKRKEKGTTARVDKYGRTVSETREKDDLRRFYRLDDERQAQDPDDAALPTVVDYARGAVLMESSDEEEAIEKVEVENLPSRSPSGDEESDSEMGGFVSLGVEPEPRKKTEEEDEEDIEIDLDENTIATLDAQVAEYAKTVPEQEREGADVKQTKRLAVVNLDWDYVRAVHLFKIFSSLLSPTAPMITSASTSHTEKLKSTSKDGGVNISRGRVLSVRVYPSEFGKKQMAKEEKEGPPTELFRKKLKPSDINEEEINEKTIFETGTEADYDEDALRNYQLKRLRYYYAIAEFDTVEAAAHAYNELEGTELERSANVFDLSFVPDDLTFGDEPRDEATQLPGVPYRAVEFVTDALRHSKVKLTWDEDDPERNHFLRRQLTKKEIDEADFRAYIASSSSSEGGSENDDEHSELRKNAGLRESKSTTSRKAEKDKLRMLLLGGDDDGSPEGWGNAFDNKEGKSKAGGKGSDVDMEVTFMPGLSEVKNSEDENTLERYQRKRKEKRKRKKDEAQKKGEVDDGAKMSLDDGFFGVGSDSGREEAETARKSTKSKKPIESSKAELALLAASDNPCGEPAHFDMKAVLKAEKQGKRSKRRLKKRDRENDLDERQGETQDDFAIDVKDDRFTAIHDDHQFAIDPTNPQFKKTKSMAALLNERSKRQKSSARFDHAAGSQSLAQQSGRSLQSLVESVKRKSAGADRGGLGKRPKLTKS